MPAVGRPSSRRWPRSPARSPTRCWRRWSPAAALDKAYVNDGGDIALFLAPGESIRAADRRHRANGFADRLVVHAADPVRGIATSGWRGRSFSLGIADAVTVLARTRGRSRRRRDDHRQRRRPARPPGGRRACRPTRCRPTATSAAGSSPTAVGALDRAEIAAALDRGLGRGGPGPRAGLIEAAALFLGGETRICGRLERAPASDIATSPREVTVHA